MGLTQRYNTTVHVGAQRLTLYKWDYLHENKAQAHPETYSIQTKETPFLPLVKKIRPERSVHSSNFSSFCS